VNSASELKFTRTVGGMLHCSLNSAAWFSREKQVGPAFNFHAFQTHNLVGP